MQCFRRIFHQEQMILISIFIHKKDFCAFSLTQYCQYGFCLFSQQQLWRIFIKYGSLLCLSTLRIYAMQNNKSILKKTLLQNEHKYVIKALK